MKKNRRSGILVLKLILTLLATPLLSIGQQDPVTSINYDSNPYFNPALMVNDYQLNVGGSYRNQWVGFDEAPVNTWAYGSYEVKRIKSTFGLLYRHEDIGAIEANDFRFNYAFRFTVNDVHHIIPAVYFGAEMKRLDGTQLDPIQQNDPNIISSSQSDVVFDMGLGLSYRFRHLLAAIGVSHLNGSKIEFVEFGATSTQTLRQHLYLVTSYDFHFGKLMRLKPLFLFRTDFAVHQMEAGLQVGFDNLSNIFERVDIGAGYREQDAVIVSAEFHFKWFSLGYAYDITLSGLKDYSDGSHQAYLRVHLFQRESEEVYP